MLPCIAACELLNAVYSVSEHFRGHEILERSNRYPGKGCLYERQLSYSSHTAENLSINFPGWKNMKQKKKKNLEKSITPTVERESERQRATVGEITEFSLWKKAGPLTLAGVEPFTGTKMKGTWWKNFVSYSFRRSPGSHPRAVLTYWQALSCSTAQPLRVQQCLGLLRHLLMGVVTGEKTHPMGFPVQRWLGGLLRRWVVLETDSFMGKWKYSACILLAS